VGGGSFAFAHFNEQANASDTSNRKKKLVILGTGWAALSLLKKMDQNLYDVTVVSPRNYFLFTPLLASTTIGTVDVRSIVEPIRTHLRGNSQFIEGKCTAVDFQNQQIEVKGDMYDTILPYDYLVIGVGAISNTFGVKGVKENCHFLKDMEHALAIRDKIMDCLEIASFPSTPVEVRKRLLNFLIVGGGPTGVELAGELSDFIHTEMKKYYPKIEGDVKITLIQSADHILNAYDRSISEYAEDRFLTSKRVDIKVNTRVLSVEPDRVECFDRTKKENSSIPYGICVWCTGIMAPPLIESIIKSIPEQTHSKVLLTDSRLRVRGVNNVWALGDCATVHHEKIFDHMKELFQMADTNGDGVLQYEEFVALMKVAAPQYPQLSEYANRVKKLFVESDLNRDNVLQYDEFMQMLKKVDSKVTTLPATAQCAAQQGKYLAGLFHTIANDTKSPSDHQHFEFKPLGTLAYVGSESAVGEVGRWRLTGFATWWLWRATTWFEQYSLRNKMLVAFDWMKTKIFGRDISRF